MMTRFVAGKPVVTHYVPSVTVNAGDVVVVGNRPFVAHEQNPETSLQGSPVVTFQRMGMSCSGGIYQMASDAAYPNGTYCYWNPTNQEITESGTSGGQCVPFGWIVGGPQSLLNDGGPTGAAGFCLVEHDPTDDTGQILSCSANASDIITNTGSATAFSTTVTIPAGSLIAGDTIHVKASGAITAQNSTNTNLFTLQATTNTNTNTTFLNTGAINAAAGTGFIIDGDFVFPSVGNAGIVNFVGDYGVAGTSRTVVEKINTTINTNVAIIISVTDTQSAASASNSVQLIQLLTNKIRR